MSYSDNYNPFLQDLRNGNITHSEFLQKTGNDDGYRKWCREHSMKPCEDNAELYFDMHGFKESEVEKEYVEPVI